MRNLKIGTRLGLGFGLVIILMLFMSVLGGWQMLATQEDNADIKRRQLVSLLTRQWEGAARVNTTQTLALASLNDPGIQAQFKNALAQTDQQALELRARIEPELVNQHAKDLFQQALQIRDTFYQGRDQAFKDQAAGDFEKARIFFHQDMPRLTQSYLEQVDALADFQQQYVSDTIDASDRDNNRSITILAAVSAFALLFAPLFAWRVTRSITHPLRTAVRLAVAVAKRDLTHDILPQGKDEVSELEQSLHEMVGGLQETVSQVRTGADAIAMAAAQISAGNLDLSARTEQQSSSLAETAASMEEITSTVRQNADNAQQANALAVAAARSASDGGGTVTSLVDTMGDINVKSQQIADIVGVIDSIAFQTNILALNAAVEAARAGEQGRGFAVVASEVRALAQRSATSAKEIKSLIDAAVGVISKGNDQANQAGTSMQELVHDINRVTDIMGEISAASGEQTSGIEQINIAVTQMDDVTRQNASLVEESAAAASSLEDQAATLARLVATFRLSGQDLGHSATAGRKAIPAAPEKVVSPAPRHPQTAARAPQRAQASQPALSVAAAAPTSPEWTTF